MVGLGRAFYPQAPWIQRWAMRVLHPMQGPPAALGATMAAPWCHAQCTRLGNRRQASADISHLYFCRPGTQPMSQRLRRRYTPGGQKAESQRAAMRTFSQALRGASFSRLGSAVTTLVGSRSLERWSRPTSSLSAVHFGVGRDRLSSGVRYPWRPASTRGC